MPVITDNLRSNRSFHVTRLLVSYGSHAWAKTHDGQDSKNKSLPSTHGTHPYPTLPHIHPHRHARPSLTVDPVGWMCRVLTTVSHWREFHYRLVVTTFTWLPLVSVPHHPLLIGDSREGTEREVWRSVRDPLWWVLTWFGSRVSVGRPWSSLLTHDASPKRRVACPYIRRSSPTPSLTTFAPCGRCARRM